MEVVFSTRTRPEATPPHRFRALRSLFNPVWRTRWEIDGNIIRGDRIHRCRDLPFLCGWGTLTASDSQDSMHDGFYSLTITSTELAPSGHLYRDMCHHVHTREHNFARRGSLPP